MSDGSDYGTFDTDFTLSLEDYASIDAMTAAAYASASLTSGPSVVVELESMADESLAPPLKTRSHREHSREGNAYAWQERNLRSPYEQFRSWRKGFTVTDLVGPVWCELQFDYGLRQRRHRKLDERPASFTTHKGKEITVERDVAVVNDRITKRGQSVHKALEKEIKPEEVHVKVTTDEERWALRMLNMISSLESLESIGFCREMPVFGIVHGQVVTGIIDEIHRRQTNPSVAKESEISTSSSVSSATKRSSTSPEVQQTPSKRRQKRSKPLHGTGFAEREDQSQSQAKLHAFFSTSPRKKMQGEDTQELDNEEAVTGVTTLERMAGATCSSDLSALHGNIQTKFVLHLSDTKTRHRPGLPSHEDTLPARLQLMLYHQLLSAVLKPCAQDSRIPDDFALCSPEGGFEFPLFWELVGVDDRKPLSRAFLEQAALIIPGLLENYGIPLTSSSPKAHFRPDAVHVEDADYFVLSLNLENVVQAWRDAVQRLDLAVDDRGTGGLDDELEIVYRKPGVSSRSDLFSHSARQESPKIGPGDRGIPPNHRTVAVEGFTGDTIAPEAVDSRWDQDLAAAILLSLQSQDGISVSGSLDTSAGTCTADVRPTGDLADSGATTDTAKVRSMTRSHSSASLHTQFAGDAEELKREEVDAMNEVTEPLLSDLHIVGRKMFRFDGEMLDRHLQTVLEWWHGRREPRGVEVENSGRCFTCEYRSGCEWRERKAEEARQLVAARRAARDNLA